MVKRFGSLKRMIKSRRGNIKSFRRGRKVKSLNRPRLSRGGFRL